MLYYKKLVFQHILGFSSYLSILNAFQNGFKWFLKYLKCTYARTLNNTFTVPIGHNVNKIINKRIQDIEDAGISSKVLNHQKFKYSFTGVYIFIIKYLFIVQSRSSYADLISSEYFHFLINIKQLFPKSLHLVS